MRCPDLADNWKYPTGTLRKGTLNIFFWRGEVGACKVQAYPRERRVPKCSLPRKTLQTRDLELPLFEDTPEFAQPRWSRVKGLSSPAGRYKFGCVCSYMAGVISHQRNDWPYRNKHTQICTLSLGMTALWDPTGPYSNGAVQIRVDLELADQKRDAPLLSETLQKNEIYACKTR